jgi:hypothetical protein
MPNWWKSQCLSTLLFKHRHSILWSRGSVPRLVYDGNSCSCSDNFYFPRLLTCWENHQGALKSGNGVTTRKMDWTRENSISLLWERKLVQPDRRIVTIYIYLHRLQTKFSYTFILHSNVQRKLNEINAWYLSQLHKISSSGTKDFIDGIYSVVQNVYDCGSFHFVLQGSLAKLLAYFGYTD